MAVELLEARGIQHFLSHHPPWVSGGLTPPTFRLDDIARRVLCHPRHRVGIYRTKVTKDDRLTSTVKREQRLPCPVKIPHGAAAVNQPAEVNTEYRSQPRSAAYARHIACALI
jgi:hypothetical protein